METPYLKVVDQPRMMKGKGAPRSTVFGVLGRTKYDSYSKSLGGLVNKAPGERFGSGTVIHKAGRITTERNTAGAPSKTPMPGAHYGQIPYPGVFQSHKGDRL